MHEPPALQLTTVLLQLAIVLASVLLNGFFVASEFALVSVRRTRIDQLAAEGSQTAKVVQNAVHDLDRYIAATQVGITVASLLLGGIGERTLEPLIDALFRLLQLPESLLGITRGSIAFFLAYFVMTALHVVIGELMPKSIALQKAESTCLIIARPMVLFAKLFAPLIWMLNGTGNFLLHLIGFHTADGHATVHSAEELDLLFTQSHEGGQLSQTERELLHRVVKFSDLTAREVMVPRVEIKAIPFEMPCEEFVTWLHSRPPSRTPVFRGSLDEIIGVAHLKDLVAFEAQLRARPDAATEAGSTPSVNLVQMARDALRVPETITIDRLLVEFQKARQQMAIVIDEYGGTAGLITMGDLFEQVVGDVHDEFDRVDPEFVQRAPHEIEVAGRVLIDEINERYGVGFRADDADTIAGLVLSELGRPAQIGDEIEINAVRLRVEALDRLRITKILLRLPESSTYDGENER
jgi:CBS domain containing-hemolysin-like protein